MQSTVRVRIPHDEGFVAQTASPPILQSESTRVVSFDAYARGPLEVAAMCTATPLSVWTDEARPFVLEKAEGLLAKLGGSVHSPPLHRVADHAGNLDQLDFAGENAVGRVFVSFVDFEGSSSLAVCAAVCAHSDDCHQTMVDTRLEGTVLLPKPLPSLSIRLLLGAVHHPQGTALAFALVLLLAGVLAVAFRKRPAAA